MIDFIRCGGCVSPGLLLWRWFLLADILLRGTSVAWIQIHYHSSWKVSSTDFIAENFPEYLGKYRTPFTFKPTVKNHIIISVGYPDHCWQYHSDIITQLSGIYNMTGKSPVEIEIYGHAGRDHTKVYPTYENAEGYQIRPDKSRHFDTGATLYYWKVKKREFEGLNCFIKHHLWILRN